MSRAHKGIEITVFGKVSERSAGTENVAYLREKLKTMKMADLVRYLVSVARRYESGELFGSEVKQILAELQLNNTVAYQGEVSQSPAKPAAVAKQEPMVEVDEDLINDLLDSIQGLN
ncbi:MAG TPA: hypothetical protein VIM29_01695 [Bacillota bacterium]